MAKTSLEKIASWDEEIAQIKNKQKLERQKHQRENEPPEHAGFAHGKGYSKV